MAGKARSMCIRKLHVRTFGGPAVVLLLGVVIVHQAWGAALPSESAGSRVRAITRPSADVVLSFVQPGRIAKVLAKEGELVKAGQVLAQQDDAAEQVLLAQLKAQAEDRIQIRASEASLAQKRVDLQKIERAAAGNAATALEVEHARLDVTVAELSLELAKFEREQAARKYEEQKVRVEHLQLQSPIEGRIEDVKAEVGESINAAAEVVRVVQIDPLWIDVPVPLAQALDLQAGRPVQVQFGPPERPAGTEEGHIIFVAAVADAASGTRRVRIEVPNKAGRPAGEHVLVAF
jgi:multidrug efflux system membrane fusion protein